MNGNKILGRRRRYKYNAYQHFIATVWLL